MTSGWNLWVWLECIGVVVDVVVRRYIDFLLIIITFPYSTCISSFFGSSIPTSLFIFNPRCTCARGLQYLVCLSVCLCVFPILAPHAIKTKTKDTIMLSVRFAAILKWRFSLNCLIRKLE